ncbi:ImmA/IrrE family metallo-endopeptidase [Mycoplasmatota bacterium]|nr:ImmA/IrrE family metallo-endopeptidase [Mycoplasmatota bacterium]
MCYEDFVNTILLDRGINSIEQLNIECLAAAFNINVYYWNCKTFLLTDEDVTIAININKDKVEQYEEFLHELGHYILYQNHIKLITDLGEWKYIEGKVNQLVPYIAIPKFAMKEALDQESIYEVSSIFKISTAFVEKRLTLFKNKILKAIGF